MIKVLFSYSYINNETKDKLKTVKNIFGMNVKLLHKSYNGKFWWSGYFVVSWPCCPAPFNYIVWQKGYFHPFPLTVGLFGLLVCIRGYTGLYYWFLLFGRPFGLLVPFGGSLVWRSFFSALQPLPFGSGSERSKNYKIDTPKFWVTNQKIYVGHFLFFWNLNFLGSSFTFYAEL